MVARVAGFLSVIRRRKSFRTSSTQSCSIKGFISSRRALRTMPLVVVAGGLGSSPVRHAYRTMPSAYTSTGFPMVISFGRIYPSATSGAI
ncbi:hypothetical protein ATCV1_z611L [Acanthocystis turfacea chlorella virus 1]|uniref:Uncharacterized protein z611L n=1 Tax=Chlorovirus heliozoae TaxID=322019 RepID=A7K9M1_9PHYC|nr:hypothetical protein ATCV1_z611L [Acanthocystis turfacea chlorella virus 1]ABT16745.1 hypothetical protein ATCV1_z611L [Acanthocystis turfacea chlorella virus 1]